MTNKLNSNFPKNFLWGAALAAHQAEGGNHNQWTVWELENAKVKAAQAEYHISDFDSWDKIKKQAKNPDNYVSDLVTNHYERYSEDFDLLEKLNMNAFRFSVEWSRIEPIEGAFNPTALSHYREYIKELRKRNIEPVMTLFHFTLPVWFAEMGGFKKRSNVKYFVRFAKKVVDEIGANVKYIITINEPEVYAVSSYYLANWPPMEQNALTTVKVINNLIYAHKKVAKEIHKISRRHKVSIAKSAIFYYPGDNSWLSHVSAAVMQYFHDDYILNKIIKSCDFIGVNYYLSSRVYGYRVHNPEDKLSDVNWSMQPADIQFVLERLHRKYKKPIFITENGLADAEDKNRQWWITETILGMQNALKYGVKITGYLHWSLTDNFEWAYGKWPRFGLTEINYETGERKLRPSALWFGRIIKKIREP